MKRNILLVMFSLLVISLACNSSTGVIPSPINKSTPTIDQQSSSTATQPPATQNLESFNDSGESPRQVMQAILENARKVDRDITYCTVNSVDLKMDIYSPKNANGKTPLVVFIHGGGWSTGDKGRGHGRTEFPALLKAGFTVASLNYRLAPEYEFPAMLEDVKCAIRSLRANANKYNIDPDRIGVWGESAGAHLANMIGLTDESAGFDVGEYPDQSSRVRVVVDMSGPADLTVDFSRAFIEAKNNAFVGYDLVKASPVTHITSDDPPFLILQGDADPVVPVSQAQFLYDRLAATGVESQLVIVANGNHTLNAPNQSPSRTELTEMIVQFFEQYLK